MSGRSFGERVVAFNKNLAYEGVLPDGIFALNPFFDNPQTLQVMETFYQKFYGDNRRRRFIIGINPSRHGAGVTGVPFTDTKRLETVCGIPMHSAHTHEISSVFLYDVIEAYGGAPKFYADFYINSPFPLALVQRQAGKETNINYYDKPQLFLAVKSFMVDSIKKHIELGLETDRVYVLGKKNAAFLAKINAEHKFFGEMVVLEHPRYIQQYRSRDRQLFIDKFILAFQQ